MEGTFQGHLSIPLQRMGTLQLHQVAQSPIQPDSPSRGKVEIKIIIGTDYKIKVYLHAGAYD